MPRAVNIARTIQVPDEAWAKVGVIATALDRSKSWVVNRLIEHAYKQVDGPSRVVGGPRVLRDDRLEELGLR